MSKADPSNVDTHSNDPGLIGGLINMTAEMLGGSNPTHETVITGPNGATYTALGESAKESEQKAGDKYRNGKHD